jgi:hypothetical protein
MAVDGISVETSGRMACTPEDVRGSRTMTIEHLDVGASAELHDPA